MLHHSDTNRIPGRAHPLPYLLAVDYPDFHVFVLDDSSSPERSEPPPEWQQGATCSTRSVARATSSFSFVFILQPDAQMCVSRDWQIHIASRSRNNRGHPAREPYCGDVYPTSVVRLNPHDAHIRRPSVKSAGGTWRTVMSCERYLLRSGHCSGQSELRSRIGVSPTAVANAGQPTAEFCG